MPQSDRAGRQHVRPSQPGDPDAQLRGLIGAGRSRLPPATAMRARDVARPSADDLAEAERVVVLRRGQRTTPAANPDLPTARHGRASADGRGEGGQPRPPRRPDGRSAGSRRPAPAPHLPAPAAPGRSAGQDAEDAVPDAEGTSPVRS